VARPHSDIERDTGGKLWFRQMADYQSDIWKIMILTQAHNGRLKAVQVMVAQIADYGCPVTILPCKGAS
jgi:hypothetical protein